MKKIKQLKEYLPLIGTCLLFFMVLSFFVLFPTFGTRTDANEWDGTIADSFAGGNGTLDNPYIITNGNELAYLKMLLESNDVDLFIDKHYRIANNIHMGNREFFVSNEEAFSGVIDGDAYTISNFTIIDSLFLSLHEATIKNINFNSVIVQNTDEHVSGMLASISEDSTFENITISLTYEISEDNYVGTVLGIDSGSKFKNLIIDADYDIVDDLEDKVAAIIYSGTETTFENVLLKANSLEYFVVNENIEINNILEYTVNNSAVAFKEGDTVEILKKLIDSDIYEFKVQNGKIVFSKIPVAKMMMDGTSSILNVVDTVFEIHPSGIVGDTVFINDLEADWNYFQGLNYVESSTGFLPSGVNQNLYNETNLVRVQLIYDGTDPIGNFTGFVSLTELQSRFIYYRYFPVVNGRIEIELIDNPYANRPTNKGFNNWVVNGPGTITFDPVVYKRFLSVPVTFENGLPRDMVVSLHASWVNAAIREQTTAITAASGSGQNTWATAIGSLHTKTMQRVDVTGPNTVNFDMGTAGTNFFLQRWIPNGGSTAGLFPANNHITPNGPTAICTTSAGCTMYELILPGHIFNSTITYYRVIATSGSNRFGIANITDIPFPRVVVEPYTNRLMAGYFREIRLPQGTSQVGFFTVAGANATGNCTTSAGCIVYEYIQTFDALGNPSIANTTDAYFFNVTRDTNILVLRATANVAWAAAQQNRPFTLTSIHNGVDYRNFIWTLPTGALIQMFNDTTLEFLTLNSALAPVNNAVNAPTETNRYIHGNFNNLKIGRGMRSSNPANLTARGIVGGSTGATGTAASSTRYNLIIESGMYQHLSLTNTSGTSNLYVTMTGTYGSDFDRVIGNNTALNVVGVASGSWGGFLRFGGTTEAFRRTNHVGVALTVKSGTFGSNMFDHTTGIYVGGRNTGTHAVVRTAKIEGGRIFNLIGGPLSDSVRGTTATRDPVNDIFIYQTGGYIEMITAGAGTTATQGNRIVSLTGGEVGRSVFGGSNGWNASGTDGTIHGSSFIYVGGNSRVGSGTRMNSAATLYGVETGSVFGMGNGNSGSNSIGSMDSSRIIIDGNAQVFNNIYGGGNFGAVGVVSSRTAVSSNIELLSGIVHGSVYGAGNRNGAGTSGTGARTATLNVNMRNGRVNGSLFGGANVSGTVHGSTNVNIIDGEVGTNVYGGGSGIGTVGTVINNFVSQNVNVTIGTNNTVPLIQGNVYGGSALGIVNGTARNTTITSFTTNVTINNGIIQGSVFGGGEGSSTVTPWMLGHLTVNINGGNIGRVFGGADQNGIPNGNSPVNLNGGIVGEVYGGGNNATVRNTQVFLRGATVSSIYGGSNMSGSNTSSTVNINSGTVSNVYGGNNIGGTVTTTNVNINGTATITNEVYGGGNLASAGTTNVNLVSAENTIPLVFGGGRNANVTTSNIIQNGIPVRNLFGGSNSSGVVANSRITFNQGSVENLFGGNNEGGETLDAIINIVEGTIENIYGGGNEANTRDSILNINGGTIENVYGGGNAASITSTILNINNGKLGNVYGGSNQSGTAHNVVVNVRGFYTEIETLYGGNNAGGQTNNALVTMENGTVGTLYAGGNAARIANNTRLEITGGTIINNAYGGGNYGPVDGSTDVLITDGIIGGSIYAGGNGATAVVHGNTRITIGGTSVIGNPELPVSPINGSVYGSGNAAATGTSATNNSLATVNIAGGTIHGNVYGGANTSIVFGSTELNIGINSIENTNLTPSDIYIGGTVFGGGEANAEGSEIFDFSFISVTQGIDMEMDGSGHGNFEIKGSIFGSGNASSSAGESNITIRNYGTINNPQKNISIQRTNRLLVDNSSINLSGTSDRTNEFSDVPFSLSRVDLLQLQNNSNLFLETSTNVLRNLESLTSSGELAEVQIDEDAGTITKNTDNRLYIFEGRNINIANNESVTSFGEVSGMTFFGMFTYDHEGNVNMGIYNPSFNYGDPLNWAMMPARGSYVLGLHKLDHDIEVDGFYSHFMDEETETNKISFIVPTPEDAAFYMWSIGEPVIEYEIDLIASKYSTLGTAELSFIEFTAPNTTFQVLGFDYSGLKSEVSLVEGSTIPRIAPNSDIADTVMGLSMRPGLSGWLTRNETRFLTTEPNIRGSTTHIGENSTAIQSLIFYLNHSKNLSDDDDLGAVRVSMMVTTRIDALNYEQSRINININLSIAIYVSDSYEGSMTPGREYSMFSPSITNITSRSSLSAYYSLYLEGPSIYRPGFHRVLVSTLLFPVNTKITMIDFAGDTPTYYYHVINEADVIAASIEHALYGEASYMFSMFTKMGTVDGLVNYDDAAMNEIYFDPVMQKTDEAFTFIIDFDDANITSNQLNNTLTVELRNADNQTIINVLGIQHASLTFSIFSDSDAYINVDAELDTTTIYAGHQINLNVETTFRNSIISGNPIFDTSFFDQRLGLKIQLLDYNGNIVSGTSLMGVNFIFGGMRHFPGIDGAIRINTADRVGNISKSLIMDMSTTTLATGTYTLQIEAFGSPDGIYYGDTTSGVATIPIIIINDIYGLNAIISDDTTIIDATTGFNQIGESAVDVTVLYKSELASPNIRLQMFRRKYDIPYSTEFELVDLQDFVTNTVSSTSNTFEYIIIDNPDATNRVLLLLRPDLLTGTYRLDFNLYDGDIFIGKISRFIIIK